MSDVVKKTLIQLKREAKQLSRSQFARKIGVTPGYVKVVEKMKVQPSTELLEKVGEELSIPYEKLAAEYRKKGGASAAPPSRRRGQARAKKDGARKERPVTPLFNSAAPLIAAHDQQDELVTIALRSQQGVEMVLRALNERTQGRPARARALVRQFQQLLAELVAYTARAAVSEQEREADEDELAAGGAVELANPFRPSAS